MPILKLQITNPQAIELINKIKSGEFVTPVVSQIKKNRWYIVSFFVLMSLITALIIGKNLSEKAKTPVFTPPEIENPIPTESTIIKSQFSVIKEEIQNINTDLPDPFIPVFDNVIDLETPVN